LSFPIFVLPISGLAGLKMEDVPDNMDGNMEEEKRKACRVLD
jgi:hypothetical protein